MIAKCRDGKDKMLWKSAALGKSLQDLMGAGSEFKGPVLDATPLAKMSFMSLKHVGGVGISIGSKPDHYCY